MRTLARSRVENELRLALDNNELRLVYQPVVGLRDETIDGVEMLLRWQQPLREPVGPSEFIAVAEESGLIDRIGTWALQEALNQVSRLAWSRPDAAPLKLGLNISVYQLQNPRFVDVVREALAGSDVDPSSVYLEFGEQVLREEYKNLRPVLHRLRGLGAKLVIHDFGAGDSSLTQLAEMPIDTIKVDRRFVGKLGTDDVGARIGEAAALASMALRRAVVGIGAETVQQVQELRRLGCHAAQGHFFSEAAAGRPHHQADPRPGGAQAHAEVAAAAAALTDPCARSRWHTSRRSGHRGRRARRASRSRGCGHRRPPRSGRPSSPW